MEKTLFKNVSILDCSGADPYAGEVLVQGNRIAAVSKTPLAADGARVVDGGGATLMPGLVEAHSHLSFCDTSTLEALGEIPPDEHLLMSLRNAKTMLDHGFTSCNSAAAAKPRLDIMVKKAIDQYGHPGPRTLAASPELTVTGGLGDVRMSHLYRETFAIICDGPDEFRKVAREMVREGVDTLKINPSGDEFVPWARASQTVMNEAEIAAVCEVAQSRGKRVAAHARSAESVKLSLKHGVEIIYHATLADAAARDMLEAHKDRVFVAPTLGISYTTLNEASKWGISSEVAESLGIRRELEVAVENMKDLKQRGVRVMPGGDYGFAWNPIGTNARDIEHFVNLLGFTPMDAILAATKWGGEIMMKAGELGQIKPGFLADILLVDGNPLANVKLLQSTDNFLAIMKDGVFYKPLDLERKAQRKAA
jgi:imidazolonepropionase-like amidohydrolase